MTKSLFLDIQPSDYISQLKRTIEEQTGFDLAQYRLMIEGRELTDDPLLDNLTLTEGMILDQSTLHLVLKQDDILIFIRTLTGNILAFDVDLYGTVEELKAKIVEKEGIPIGQQKLFLNNRTMLEDSKTLASYPIRDETLLQLYIRFHGYSG